MTGRDRPVELVVTDLDGTVWDGTCRVHPATLDAWRRLEDAGVPVLVATGRRRRSTLPRLAEAGLAPPVVVLGGALGVDPATGHEFHRRDFAPEHAAAVLDAFRGAGLEPCVYVDRPDCEVVVGERPATHPRHLASLRGWVRTGDLDRIVAGRGVLGFGVIGRPRDRLEPVLTTLDSAGHAVVNHDLVHGDHTLMVAPPGISKWEGVEAFCRDRGLDPGGVLAVGDGANDAELLDRAAVACAVAGGADEALARADHVVDPPERGGWASVADLVRGRP